MTRRNWVRLDNASNIFLAARSDIDTKVFRITAELDHHIDPDLLQRALDTTYDDYKLYHAVLRRAIFWYYLQDSDLRPVVTEDDQPTCAAIYDARRPGLLFRVTYYRRRINLEVFHALSDGTGALWFLTDLVAAYTKLRYREPEQPVSTDTAQLTAQPGGIEDGATARALTRDSFATYFHGKDPKNTDNKSDAAPLPTPKHAYRVRGTRTPDNRTRAVEVTMPVHEVLALAKAEGISLTMYLTALFFDSIRRTTTDLGRSQTLAATIPVNLRQFFPSVSPRNFFATIRVAHTYGHGPDDIGSIGRALEQQFRPQATPEALERKLRRFARFERTPLLRIVPRPLKDLILKLVNRINNRGLSVSVSNLGRVSLPEPVDSHVGRMGFHVSAVRPQMCAMSHAGQLTVIFSSPFTETDHIRAFARDLTSHDVAVSVAAARVTEDELDSIT